MKKFDKSIIEVVAEKLNLSPDYIAWLLSVGNKQALQEYEAAEQKRAADVLKRVALHCTCPTDADHPNCPVHGTRRR